MVVPKTVDLIELEKLSHGVTGGCSGRPKHGRLKSPYGLRMGYPGGSCKTACMQRGHGCSNGSLLFAKESLVSHTLSLCKRDQS